MDPAFPAPSRPANDSPILQSSQLPETSHPHLSNIQCSPPGPLISPALGSPHKEQIGMPPVQEGGIPVTFVHWMDFNENVRVAHEDDIEGAHAQGVEARVLIQCALPVEGLNLRSCHYYRAPNGDMITIEGSIPWATLNHYRLGTGSDARIILPLYKWAAPLRFTLIRIAALAFHLSMFIVFIVLSQALPQLRPWLLDVVFVLIGIFFFFLAVALFTTPFSRTASWDYFLRGHYARIRQLIPCFDM